MPDPTELAGDSRTVAARLRYIERQERLDPGSFDVGAAGQEEAGVAAPMGSGPPNRHGLPKLPEGQREVRNWPVLDLGDQPDVARETWRLDLGGLVENPVTLDLEGLFALPQVDQVCDFHCVTTWSRMDLHFRGVPFRALAELVVPLEAAAFVSVTGYDHLPGTDVPYTTNLPLARAVEEDVLLVHEWDGEPLPREHGGPVRMVTPRLYAWKGAKWVRSVEFLAEDRPGFWEQRGYSNGAEPWRNDRYSRR